MTRFAKMPPADPEYDLFAVFELDFETPDVDALWFSHANEAFEYWHDHHECREDTCLHQPKVRAIIVTRDMFGDPADQPGGQGREPDEIGFQRILSRPPAP